MPFGLSNTGAMFQKAMDMAFHKLMYKIVLVYLDDITLFSKKSTDHADHLQKIFMRSREFGISLNPKKCIFYVHEGRLLGFVVSKHGIIVDPKRVTAIVSLPLPTHKKELQSFIGRINFFRRFILDIVDLLSPLSAMLRKNVSFHWTKEGKRSFKMIKEELPSTLTLTNPYFTKDFILYAYGNVDSISIMLVQKNIDDFE